MSERCVIKKADKNTLTVVSQTAYDRPCRTYVSFRSGLRVGVQAQKADLGNSYNPQLHRPMLPARPVLSHSSFSSRQSASSSSGRRRRADWMISE